MGWGGVGRAGGKKVGMKMKEKRDGGGRGRCNEDKRREMGWDGMGRGGRRGRGVGMKMKEKRDGGKGDVA